MSASTVFTSNQPLLRRWHTVLLYRDCVGNAFRSTNEVELLIIVLLLTHLLITCCTVVDMYVCMRRCVCAGIEIGDTLPWQCWLPLDKRSGRSLFQFLTQGLTSCYTVVEARVVKYMLVSKLEMLLHSCNSNWRNFFVGRSSSASPRKLIHVDHGSP